jgi:hypothetical protein
VTVLLIRSMARENPKEEIEVNRTKVVKVTYCMQNFPTNTSCKLL